VIEALVFGAVCQRGTEPRGGFISESRAKSSRNAWATLSGSAPLPRRYRIRGRAYSLKAGWIPVLCAGPPSDNVGGLHSTPRQFCRLPKEPGRLARGRPLGRCNPAERAISPARSGQEELSVRRIRRRRRARRRSLHAHGNRQAQRPRSRYLREVIGRIADHPINRIGELLRWIIGPCIADPCCSPIFAISSVAKPPELPAPRSYRNRLPSGSHAGSPRANRSEARG
jgi:hypothetical protein